MSTSSIPHSVPLAGNLTNGQFNGNDPRHKKYATLEKCNSLVQFNENASTKTVQNQPTINFEWYKQFRRSAHQMLTKSKSDAAHSSRRMQHTNKSMNRNGTIAHNYFRGVPADFLDKHTKHFLLTMTVSMRNCSKQILP